MTDFDSGNSPDFVLLADDHAAIRMGVRALVASLWPEARVVEVSDGISLQKELSARRWGLVVLDQSMPGANGLDSLKRVPTSAPVLVYTMHETPELVGKVREAGAKGFVSKSSGPEVLEKAMVALVLGDQWFPEKVGSTLDALSPRERLVMEGLLEGLGPKEIGVRLSISASSVQTHTTRLLAKLDLRSTRDLFRWAASKGGL
jgi:DNA-binding NarL/FixJ family response regulator